MTTSEQFSSLHMDYTFTRADGQPLTSADVEAFDGPWQFMVTWLDAHGYSMNGGTVPQPLRACSACLEMYAESALLTNQDGEPVCQPCVDAWEADPNYDDTDA